MFHGLTNRYLYSAYRVEVLFVDGIGNTKSGSGTGFFVQNRSKELAFVTNRHMLDITYKKGDKYKDYALHQVIVSGKRDDPTTKQPTADIKFLVDHSNVRVSDNYNNDVASLINPNVHALSGQADATIDYFIPYELVASKEDIKGKLIICDFVAFPGYPPWYDKRIVSPILRTGTISSDPRFDYSHSGGDDGECIAYEAFSYGGSSGSPIFAVQKGPTPGVGISFPGFRELLFIGINAGHLETEGGAHSGISYLYKSSAILDIIDKEPNKAAQSGRS